MRYLRNIELKDKRVFLRADFNEPIENGKLVDDFKIRASLETIEYLIKQKTKIILASHLGRPSGQVVEELRLNPIAERLSKLLDRPIKKLDDSVGPQVEEAVSQMKEGEIILLENIQFNPGEKEKSEEYIKALAKLADVFVLDAFGQSHRDYASISGLAKVLPSYAGLLLEKEIKNLKSILKNPQRPFTVVIGGAKISTKIKFIKRFLETSDDLILGGALANTVISAKGFAIGKSVSEEEMVEEVKRLNLTDTKLHIPVDVIVSVDSSGQAPAKIAPVGKTEEEEMILDIGPDTVSLFSKIINRSGTVIWNGPMGLFEIDKFAAGSKIVAEQIAKSSCFSVVGGGDSITLLNKLGLLGKINHISTGGGAMLSFLSGEKLPGIEALE